MDTTLIYAGQRFDIMADGVDRIARAIQQGDPSVTVDTIDGCRLTVALSPGVPVAIVSGS